MALEVGLGHWFDSKEEGAEDPLAGGAPSWQAEPLLQEPLGQQVQLLKVALVQAFFN